MISSLLKLFAAPILLISSILTPVQQAPTLGASLPTGTALFETSLSAPITSSATTMTLAANSIRGGGSLSGYDCFTIDEGSAQAETVCGTVASTTVSSLQRGISQANGTSTVAALQFSHRRGANVKKTDFPLIQIIRSQNNGDSTFDTPIRYATSVSTTSISLNSQNLASVGYANSLAFGGVPAASEAASGFVELATGQEAASSTSIGGTGARLVIPASAATSTKPASGNYAVITKVDGSIDPNFFSGGSLSNLTLTGTTTLSATSTYITMSATSSSQANVRLTDIGKNFFIASSTGTSTFVVPRGVTRIKVTVVGGGGAGSDITSTTQNGGGGGGAGTAIKWLDVSATSSITYFVGGRGQTAVNGQASSIGSVIGLGGASVAANTAAGAAGGAATGGDINLNGATGASAGAVAGQGGGSGGSSFLGFGGGGGGNNANGNGGGGYGGAGGGASSNADTPDKVGAGGQDGVIIFEW